MSKLSSFLEELSESDSDTSESELERPASVEEVEPSPKRRKVSLPCKPIMVQSANCDDDSAKPKLEDSDKEEEEAAVAKNAIAIEPTTTKKMNFVKVPWEGNPPVIVHSKRRRRRLLKERKSKSKLKNAEKRSISQMKATDAKDEAKHMEDTSVLHLDLGDLDNPCGIHANYRLIWFCPIEANSKSSKSKAEAIGTGTHSNSDSDDALGIGSSMSSERMARIEGEKKRRGKKQQKRHRRVARKRERQLKVWDLPISWSAQHVCDLFATFGAVHSCEFKADDSVLSRFAVLTFESSQSLANAMAFDCSGDTVVNPMHYAAANRSEDGGFIGADSDSDFEDGEQLAEALTTATTRSGHAAVGGKRQKEERRKKATTTAPKFGVDYWLYEYIRTRPQNIAKLQKEVNVFMSKYDAKVQKQSAEWRKGRHRLRGFDQIDEGKGWKRVHYPSAFLRRKNDGGDAKSHAEAELYNKEPAKAVYDAKRRKRYYEANEIGRHHSAQRGFSKFDKAKGTVKQTHAVRTATRHFLKLKKKH